MTKQFLNRALLASACGFALTAPAFAQDAAEAGDEDIIIVTAQNREQNLNDVPIAINVVTAEELQESGFANMNDIDKIAPVVQLNQDQGTVKVTIRGVGTNDGGEAQDTSVVVNIDGEYINRPSIMSTAMFDIDRVEVLRGPQGTLYGRNSTGGAINFITRKPGRDFGVNATASYGNYKSVRIDGGIDLPLGDMAGIRVAGFYEDRDGYVKYPAGGGFAFFPAFPAGRSDDNHSYGGRVSLRIEPSDALTVNLAAEYARRTFTPGTFAYADLNSGGRGPTGTSCSTAPGFTQVAPAYAPRVLCIPNNTNFLPSINRTEYAAPGFGAGHLGDETWAVRGRIAYEFSDAATLTYTGGYRSYSGDEDNKLTLPVVYQSFNFQDEAKTQSHELRLNGNIGGVIYQIGGFYFKEELDREPAFFIRPIGPNGSFLTYFGRFIESDSKSAFGQIEVPLGDKLTFIGGLRYTDNKREALYINGSPFTTYNSVATPGCPIGTCVIPGPPNAALFSQGPARKNLFAINAQFLNLGSSENKTTWLAGLNFQPDPDTLVYAKASTGFKGGGFDAVGEYNPETNLALEAGLKKGFGDHGQHQFNLSAFTYDYKDLQVSVLIDTTVGGQVFNAGKARISGLEAEAVIKLDDNTTFSASFNYLDSKYKELFATFNVYTVPGTGADLNGVGDLDPTVAGVQQPNFAGNTTPFSPKFIVTMGLEHVFQLGGAGTLTASVDTVFKSAYFASFYNYRDSKQTALTKTDLNLTYRPDDRKFFVQAFVQNLEDTRPLTFGSFISAGGDDIFNWQFGTPRLFGVRAGFDF